MGFSDLEQGKVIMLDLLFGKPAEGDELIASAKDIIDVRCGQGCYLCGIGGIDIVAGAADGGFAGCAGDDFIVGIAGIPVGADREGVIAGGEYGSDGTKDIGLARPTGKAIGIVAESGSGKTVTSGSGWNWIGNGQLGASFNHGVGIDGRVFGQGIESGLDGSC